MAEQFLQLLAGYHFGCVIWSWHRGLKLPVPEAVFCLLCGIVLVLP